MSTSTPPRTPPLARALTTALALMVTACGSAAVSPPAMPRFIEGGGLGDGPISGTLYVYVADDDTRAPVSGAAVRVGGSSDPDACTATTDSTGLAIFEQKTCALLEGKQSITASASAYTPTTWIGVDATNVTMTVRAKTAAPIDTAVVTGSIAGWDALPAPAAQHNLLGLVGYSALPTASDATNNLGQDQRMIIVTTPAGPVSFPVASNVCIRNAAANDCAWRLKTRTGAQAHYAVVLDQDTKGTDDSTDDTFTVIGWAVKTGLSFQKDVGADGESLTLLTDDQMQPFTASFPPAPTGLDTLQAFPLLDLGDAGRIAIVIPALDATHTMTRVPKLVGPFADAHYDFLAKAQDATDKPQPATLSWSHAVDATKTVAALDWTPPPTGLVASGGTYSFGAVAGASVQGAELQAMTGERAWSITIFDATTSFTLPGVSPDPLAAGPALFVASALVVTAFDPTNAKFDDLRTNLTHLASDQIMFTH
jgi:hypothetical protein